MSKETQAKIARAFVDKLSFGIDEVEFFLGSLSDQEFTATEIEEILTPRFPYFSVAFETVLFSKNNTFNYPQTNTQLTNFDNQFLGDGSYDGLSELAKAQLLANAVADAGGFDL